MAKSLHFIKAIIAFFVSLGIAIIPFESNAQFAEIVNQHSAKEIVENRGRTAKHFTMPDGSRKAIISVGSLHYEENGTWNDINNTIVQSEENGFGFKNTTNIFKTHYPNDICVAGLKTVFKTHQLKEKLNRVYYSHIISDGIVPLGDATNIKKSRVIQVKDNQITYQLSKGVQLQYTNGNDHRKFDLIINSRNALHKTNPEAQFITIEEEIELPANWKLTKDENGIRIFDETLTPIIDYPTPIAYDQKANEPVKGQIDFEKSGENVYKIFSSFNIKWVLSPERVYPIKLDPVVNYVVFGVNMATGYMTTATGGKANGFLRLAAANTFAWAKFDITSFATTGAISLNSATYYGYHYVTTGADKIASIRGLGAIDPVTALNTAIVSQIQTGPLYNGNYIFGSSAFAWRPGNLGGTISSDFIGRMSTGFFSLGMTYLSGNTTFMYQYGWNAPNAAQKPYIEIDYLTGAPIPPVANFDFTLGQDTIWQNSPRVLVNTSSGSDRSYWQITGYNPTTTNGVWQSVNEPVQCNPLGQCGIDTLRNNLHFNYTFNQRGFYRIRLTCANQFGVASIEKAVFVEEPTGPPVAEFFVDRRLLGTFDQVQFYDLSTGGPSNWFWYTDPVCNGCGGGGFPNTFNPTPNTPSPSFTANDGGVFRVCLMVSNSKGSDVKCKNNYIRVIEGNLMCSGSDSVSRSDEGYIMSNILQAPQGYFYIANQCAPQIPQGFRIAPCADTIITSLERLRMRNNDSVYIRTGSYTGPILRRYGGSNRATLHDTIINLRFAGQELFISWTPGAPNGSTVNVPDSGFSIRWTTIPAQYGPPNAAFTMPDTLYSGYTLRMNNTTTGIKPVYAWDLNGDGVFGLDNTGAGVDSITVNPTITFTTVLPIQRTICLKASNCVGADTACKQFWVLPVEQAPVADFTIDRTQGFTTDTFQLLDKSKHGPNQWKWTFEPNNVTFVPGFTTNSQNPQVFFNAPQSYDVTLEATNSEGTSTLKKFNVATARAYANPNSIFNPPAVQVDIGITTVALDTMRSDTTEAKTPTFDARFNSRRAMVFRGASYAVDVYRQTVSDAQHMKIWIDWDRDAAFSDNNEQIINEVAERKIRTTAPFSVPFDAPLGNTRMRIGVAADFATTFTATSSTMAVYEDYGIIVGVDQVKPQIVINGDTVYKTEVNKPFVDPGATASDNIEGNITNRIQRIGNVDTTTVGYYTLKYYVNDYYNNVSDTLTRLVQVEVNQTGPTITLTGQDTVRMEVFSKFNEPGFSATSNTGANLTNLVNISGNLDTATLGTYNIIYSVRDAFGFLGTQTRIVIVEDTQKPTIRTVTGRDTIDHQIETPFDVSMYLMVDDNYWGINANELIRTGTVNVTQQGLYTLRYNVVDGSGNAADEYFLSVFVRDIVPPVIVLIGNPVVQVPVFGNFEDPWVTAHDNYYPNVTVSSNRASVLNTNRVGEYTITYTAQDPAGNSATVQRLVRVIDNEPPVISVLGSNPFRMDINDDYDTIDPGVKVTDNYWPEDSIDIMIDKSQLKPSVIGTYFVYYSATDKSGNVSNLRFRRVEVAFRVGLNDKVSKHNGSVSVYPNPSAGSIQIISEATIKQITVLDMSGKKIQTITPHDLKTSLAISDNGLFMLLIETEDGTFTQKVYIQQ